MLDDNKGLDRLLVDEEKVDEDLLFGLLEPYVRIGRSTGRLVLEKRYHQELAAREKVMVLLLTQLARKQLGVADSEWLSPSAVSAEGAIKEGTVKPTVRDLFREGIIENDNGKYAVAALKLHLADSILNNKEAT